jgi:hypothetical protein
VDLTPFVLVTNYRMLILAKKYELLLNIRKYILQLQSLRQAQADRAKGHVELVEICA